MVLSETRKEGREAAPPVDKAGKSDPQSADVVLWITYINIVLYALCYQLQRPVEPFLIQSLTEQEIAEGLLSPEDSSVSQTYGNLQSFFSFCQMFGSPLVGILLDRIGIRKTSCIVFVASALSYAILASASDLNLLFVSKIPTVFQAAFLVAQATAATTTRNNAALRAAALGRMTTAYTIGATIGPALGGYLAGKGNFYIGAKLAVAGSLVSAVLSLLCLPDHSVSRSKDASTSEKTNEVTKHKGRSFLEDTRHSVQIALRPAIWPLLAVKVIGGVCASMHSTAIPLVLTQVLKFEPQQLGLVMSCGMFAVAFFGAFFMAPMTKLLGSFGMMNTGMLSRSVLGLVMAGIVTTYKSVLPTRNGSIMGVEFALVQVIVVSVLHALSQHVLATGLTTQTTGSVDNDEQGALLGLEHSLFSLARIGGPAIGTALFGLGGVFAVEMACGGIDVSTAAFLSVTLLRWSKRKDP